MKITNKDKRKIIFKIVGLMTYYEISFQDIVDEYNQPNKTRKRGDNYGKI